MTGLRRRAGWEQALADYLSECEGKQFGWGKFDCALFAADWVNLLTGVDFASEYRGHYRTRRGAARVLKTISGGDLMDAATRALGEPAVSPLLARRGDVVALWLVGLDGLNVLALGVVDEGGECAVTIGPEGLIRAPFDAIMHAWAVG